VAAAQSGGRLSPGRLILRLMGRRLPQARGTIAVPGLRAPATIRRDGWGIPHVGAQTDEDAAFALGFCHAQDRAFQLETMLRAGRGTLSALVGAEGPGLAVDRVSRRIGFHRAAAAQVEALSPAVRGVAEAYAGGVNAGLARGARRRAHEFALLRRRPTPWEAADVLGALKLLSFGLSANWDMELGRLRVLELDGPDALRAVDPAYPSWLSVTAPPGGPAGMATDRLAEDVAALAALVGRAARTTGRSPPAGPPPVARSSPTTLTSMRRCRPSGTWRGSGRPNGQRRGQPSSGCRPWPSGTTARSPGA
jgi:penicillin G amidase